MRDRLLLAALGLAGCAATGTSEPEPGLPARFVALGTEPFWAAQVEPGWLVYRTPDEQGGRRIAVRRRRIDREVEVSGALDGQPLVLRIGPGPCSDGMSDVVYPFRVERRVGAEVERGCARP